MAYAGRGVTWLQSTFSCASLSFDSAICLFASLFVANNLDQLGDIFLVDSKNDTRDIDLFHSFTAST